MVDQKFPETDQKFSETGQFFVWLTKKNKKKTGQLVDQETDQNHMDGTIESIILLITYDTKMIVLTMFLLCNHSQRQNIDE